MHAPTDLMVVLKFVCRGGYYPPVVDKNIIAFCTGRRGRRPLPVCAIFVILIVGATSGRPSFIKISFCLKRTVNLQSKYGRTVPTDLYDICYFDCRGDSRIAREQNIKHTRW